MERVAHPDTTLFLKQLLRLLLSTLSSHLLSTPSPLVLTSLLTSLVSLAPYCPDSSTFLSLLRTITSCASSPSSSITEANGDEADDAEKRFQACLTALSRLAEVAARKSGGGLGGGKLGEEGEGFLTEVLSLFNRQAASLRGKKTRPAQRSETLLALVPVLSSFLTLSSFSPSSHISSSLCALFRSFWYTCLLNGFLSSHPAAGTFATGGGWGKLSEWQQEALRSVAGRSPSLVSGVGDELVEMFAALEGVLKAGDHPMVRFRPAVSFPPLSPFWLKKQTDGS
jgi:hypothetical protein